MQREVLWRIGLFALSGFVLLFTGVYLLSRQPATETDARLAETATASSVALTATTSGVTEVHTPSGVLTAALSVPPVSSDSTSTPAPAGESAASAAPAQATQYTVAQGDTMWDIAVKHELSLEEVIAANPSVNPDSLRPGDVLNIPAPGTVDTSQVTRPPPVQPAAQATATPSGKARVRANSGNLRLRQSPSTSGRILTRLAALTPLTIVDRSADNAWLEVVLANGRRGWVMSQYVEALP